MRYIDPHKFMERRLAGRPRPGWRVAVICFTGLGGSGLVIKRLHAKPLKQMIVYGMDEPGDRPYVYEAIVGGKAVCVVSGCWWGGPQAAIVVEDLACLGVDHIIGYGLAGSISRDLPKYTHIAAVAGLTTDGTSRGYTRANSVSADAELLSTLDVMRGTLKHTIVPATIATVDTIYRETPEAVREWASMGAQAINMETTPLYAASNSCGVRSLWLGHVSDSLVGDEWDSWHDEPPSIQQDTADLTALIVESLVSTIK